MNAKKAKALRKLLRNMAAQYKEGKLPAVDYTTVPNTEKSFMMEKTDENGAVTGVEKKVVFSGQQRVAPRSERAVYLHLKKEMDKV